VAELTGTHVDDVARQTAQNAARLFGLELAQNVAQ